MIRIAGIAALLGLFLGLITGWQAHDWMQSSRALRQVNKTIKADAKETVRRAEIADSHAAVTEAIDEEREDQDASLKQYLEHRPDVAALDLGPEWLCLADRAAGIAAPRCPDEPAARLPEAASATRQQRPGDPAGVPASAEAVPDLRGSAREARPSDHPAE